MDEVRTQEFPPINVIEEEDGSIEKGFDDSPIEKVLIDGNLEAGEEDVTKERKIIEDEKSNLIMKKTIEVLKLGERYLTSLNRAGLVYVLTNASQPASTRFQLGPSFVIFSENGEWRRSKHRYYAFVPRGVPRKVVLFTQRMLNRNLPRRCAKEFFKLTRSRMCSKSVIAFDPGGESSMLLFSPTLFVVVASRFPP